MSYPGARLNLTLQSLSTPGLFAQVAPLPSVLDGSPPSGKPNCFLSEAPNPDAPPFKNPLKPPDENPAPASFVPNHAFIESNGFELGALVGDRLFLTASSPTGIFVVGAFPKSDRSICNPFKVFIDFFSHVYYNYLKRSFNEKNKLS